MLTRCGKFSIDFGPHDFDGIIDSRKVGPRDVID